ncbi:hypothetical protein E2C01_049903 [Portunus trituberculatus]|uniref:Uncharacterized protein n=1 Tax=Portunus trituberculatus TaxID=210409 RepID=A0A5B7GF16_PORTR|nr:hypothetical protein [Portunus trituberculatus]
MAWKGVMDEGGDWSVGRWHQPTPSESSVFNLCRHKAAPEPNKTLRHLTEPVYVIFILTHPSGEPSAGVSCSDPGPTPPPLAKPLRGTTTPITRDTTAIPTPPAHNHIST